MNDAPTPAKTTAFDSQFAQGATATVDGNTKALGGKPQTIAARKTSKFRGSSSQLLRQGNKRIFQDEPANHPDIPMSSMGSVTSTTPRGVSTTAQGRYLQPQVTRKNPMGKK